MAVWGLKTLISIKKKKLIITISASSLDMALFLDASKADGTLKIKK